MSQQRQCPFCEEAVIDDATICHLCGRDLGTPDGGGDRSAWRTVRSFLIIVLIALAVIALVFVVRAIVARPAPPEALAAIAELMLTA